MTFKNSSIHYITYVIRNPSHNTVDTLGKLIIYTTYYFPDSQYEEYYKILCTMYRSFYIQLIDFFSSFTGLLHLVI